MLSHNAKSKRAVGIKSFARLFKGGRGHGGQRPPKRQRDAKRPSQRGEQTVEPNHPVDGSVERLCGPEWQNAHGLLTAQAASGPQTGRGEPAEPVPSLPFVP